MPPVEYDDNTGGELSGFLPELWKTWTVQLKFQHLKFYM